MIVGPELNKEHIGTMSFDKWFFGFLIWGGGSGGQHLMGALLPCSSNSALCVGQGFPKLKMLVFYSYLKNLFSFSQKAYFKEINVMTYLFKRNL